MVPSELCSLWIFGGVLSGHRWCGLGSPGPCRISIGGSVATQVYCTWLTCVPLQEWVEEWTSEVTPKSNCHCPGHFGGLLSLSSKEIDHNSHWTVLSTSLFFLCLLWPILTQWIRMTWVDPGQQTGKERYTGPQKLHVFTVLGGSSKNDLTCKNQCDFFLI